MWSRTTIGLKRLPLRRCLAVSSEASAAVAGSLQTAESTLMRQYPSERFSVPQPSNHLASNHPSGQHHEENRCSKLSESQLASPPPVQTQAPTQNVHQEEQMIAALEWIRNALARCGDLEASSQVLLSGQSFLIDKDAGFHELEGNKPLYAKQVWFQVVPASHFGSASPPAALVPSSLNHSSAIGISVNELFLYECLVNASFKQNEYQRVRDWFELLFFKHQELASAHGMQCSCADQCFQSRTYALYLVSLYKLQQFESMLQFYQQNGVPLAALHFRNLGFALLRACQETNNAQLAFEIMRRMCENPVLPVRPGWFSLAKCICLECDEDSQRGLAHALEISRWMQSDEAGYEVVPHVWRSMALQALQSDSSTSAQGDNKHCLNCLPARDPLRSFEQALFLNRRAWRPKRFDVALQWMEDSMTAFHSQDNELCRVFAQVAVLEFIESKPTTDELEQAIALLERFKIPATHSIANQLVDHFMSPKKIRGRYLPRESVHRFVAFVEQHQELMAPFHFYVGAKAVWWCITNNWHRELGPLLKNYTERVLEDCEEPKRKLAIDTVTKIMRRVGRLDVLRLFLRAINAQKIRLDSDCSHDVVRYYLLPRNHKDGRKEVEILEDFLYFYEQHEDVFVSYNKTMRFALRMCISNEWVDGCEHLMQYFDTREPYTVQMIGHLLELFEAYEYYPSCLKLLRVLFRSEATPRYKSATMSTTTPMVEELLEDETTLCKVLDVCVAIGLHSRVVMMEQKYGLLRRFAHNEEIVELVQLALKG